jgi:hypothetical protein
MFGRSIREDPLSQGFRRLARVRTNTLCSWIEKCLRNFLSLGPQTLHPVGDPVSAAIWILSDPGQNSGFQGRQLRHVFSIPPSMKQASGPRNLVNPTQEWISGIAAIVPAVGGPLV